MMCISESNTLKPSWDITLNLANFSNRRHAAGASVDGIRKSANARKPRPKTSHFSPSLLSADIPRSQVLDDGWLRRGGGRRADPEQLGDRDSRVVESAERDHPP